MPLAPLVGVTRKVNPLHTVVDIAVISGLGFTVTTNVNVLLGQDGLVLGVTVYVAVCAI